MSYELDEFEQEILDSIENEEWVSVRNEKDRINEIVSYAKNHAELKNLDIKISKKDFDKIEKYAISKGYDANQYIGNLLHSIAERV